MKHWLLAAYRWSFARPAFFRLNQMLYSLSLRGLGVLNFEDDRLSGEEAFLRRLAHRTPHMIALDIGAHTGFYSNKIKALAPSATIYAFEPHPQTFQRLQAEAARHNYTALNLACGDTIGRMTLYDYADRTDGSQHASLYKEAIEQAHRGAVKAWDVEGTTVDHFVGQNNLAVIHLLKIDTEGHELKVLLGAEQTIAGGMVDAIHFEFNAMNVVSRVFFRDFYDRLPNYLFYRMLPTGLAPLGDYNPVTCEIFAYQNIVALRRDSRLR
jgi:FkbM family methyltransferase